MLQPPRIHNHCGPKETCRANKGNHLIKLDPKSLAAGDVVDQAVKTASALIWARSPGLIKLGLPRQIFWHSHFKCVERDEELRSGCMCSGRLKASRRR